MSIDAICGGVQAECIASTRGETGTETGGQERPEKKTACTRIGGYLEMCWGVGWGSGNEVCFC